MTTSLPERADVTSGVADRIFDQMLGYPIDRALDRALDRAVLRASWPGNVRFTVRQLYYELGRVLLPQPPRSPGSGRVPWRFGMVAPPVPVSYRAFNAALERRGRDGVPGLLPEHWPSAGDSRVPEPDVLAYGLPQLLVCQDVQTARMLLANDVHLETACPVLGEADLTARPELAGSVVTALAAAGQATVFVLHDASRAGVETPGRVRAWLNATATAAATGAGAEAGVKLVAVGIRPSDARALSLARCRRVAVPADATTPAHRTASPHGLEDWEARWLARGQAVELAAVAPHRLLRAVHRALRGQPRTRWAPPDLRAARVLGFLSWPTP